MKTSRPTVARRVALSAVLCALSLLFSYLETFIPMPVPGMKIGLANLIPLLLLPSLGAPTAACVSLIRIGLSALLFGSPVSSRRMFEGLRSRWMTPFAWA